MRLKLPPPRTALRFVTDSIAISLIVEEPENGPPCVVVVVVVAVDMLTAQETMALCAVDGSPALFGEGSRGAARRDANRIPMARVDGT